MRKKLDVLGDLDRCFENDTLPRFYVVGDPSRFNGRVPSNMIQLFGGFQRFDCHYPSGKVPYMISFRDGTFSVVPKKLEDILRITITLIVCRMEPSIEDALQEINRVLALLGRSTSPYENVLVFFKHLLHMLSFDNNLILVCKPFANPAPVTTKIVDEFFNLLRAFMLVNELDEFNMSSANVRCILDDLNKYRVSVGQWTVNNLVEIHQMLFKKNLFALNMARQNFSEESFVGCTYLLERLRLTIARVQIPTVCV